MYIYGASGHARVIIDLIDDKETIQGIFDDNPEVKEVLEYPVMHGIPTDFTYDHPFFIAIGCNRIRKEIFFKIRSCRICDYRSQDLTRLQKVFHQ